MFRSLATRSLRRPASIPTPFQSIRPQFAPQPTIRFSSTSTNKAPRRSVRSFAVRFVAVTGTLLFFYNSEIWDVTGRQVIPIPPLQEPITLPTEDDIKSRLSYLDSVSADQAKAKQLEKPSDGIAAEGEAGGAHELEQEAANQGAFNEETGEINWDCPCLGGMAHGPCGEEFRTAFSCFVYSKEDPKGIDCIEKFKGMQDCFRQHPEIYGSELSGDDDDEGEAKAEVEVEGEAVEQPTTVQGTIEDNSRDRKPTVHEAAVDDRRLGEQTGIVEELKEEVKEDAKEELKEEKAENGEGKVENKEEKEKKSDVVPAAIGTELEK